MLIILVAGCSGSGKTTVSHRICEGLISKTNKHCDILSLDHYQRDFGRLPLKERQKLNFDLPTITSWDLLKKDLEQLKKGEAIKVRPYNFELHKPGNDTFILEAPDVLFLEGIHSLHNQDVIEMADITIFVDAGRDICYQRRLARDTLSADQGGRGRTEESVKKQFDSQVWPAYTQYIEPKKEMANLVISNDTDISQLDTSVVCQHIESRLPAEYKGQLATMSLLNNNTPIAATTKTRQASNNMF